MTAWSKGYLRISQQLAYTRTFLSPTVARVGIPGGLLHEAFSASGRIRPWSIMSLIDSARVCLFLPTRDDPERSFVNFHQFWAKYLPFIISLRLDISPSVYSSTEVKAPLVVTTHLQNVGTSSLRLYHELSHAETPNLPLATSCIQNVFVSPETRRPSALPEKFRETFSKFCKDGEPLVNEPIAKPSDTTDIVTAKMQVLGSDIDPNNHTNYISYFRYCFDAMSALERHERVMLLQNDEPEADHSFPVKSAVLTYKNESSLRDTLTVDMWKDKQEENSVNFDISKMSSTIFECKIRNFTKFPH